MRTGLTTPPPQGPPSDSLRMSQQAFGVGPEYSFSRNKLPLQGGEVTGETWRVVTRRLVEQAEQISRKLGQGKSDWSKQLSVTRTPADFQRENLVPRGLWSPAAHMKAENRINSTCLGLSNSNAQA